MEVFEDNDLPIINPNLLKKSLSPKDFDAVYSLSEDKMLEEVINKELDKVGMSDKLSLVPEYIIRRKNVMNFIFSILMFVFVSSIFFHLSVKIYVIGILVILVFRLIYAFFTKFNFMKYLIKQVKKNPKEKILNIVTLAKNDINFKYNGSKARLYIIVPILLALIIFIKPKIFYEEVDGGYAVRLYTFGVLNFRTAEIPEYHNNKKVVTLRGNAFSDMPFLKSVKLPDSIIEIRGQAFKNCISLSDVNIPKNLEYLGWSAFANAISIKSIELPDTLTYLWWEAFNWAISLQNVVLSNNLTEIRWDTFKGCTSLKKIIIPDWVTRIWGSAFNGASWLFEVVIWESSQLQEIGWWAFYNASSLKSIVIPDTVTRIWWEAFYWASSLENVVLSKNLEEIRWDSFEFCTSLKSIIIPDTVTRIWGHAFYGDKNLSEVIIGENSKLQEIWSSAFRQCSSLYTITIPSWTYVNERAFKESPTSVNRY